MKKKILSLAKILFGVALTDIAMGMIVLPQNFAVAPYYEMALDQAHPVRESMLAELLLLDALFASEQA